MRNIKILISCLLFGSIAFLGGCASEPGAGKEAAVTVTTDYAINKNSQGIPSPIDFTFYQLKEKGNFLDSNYLDLNANAANVLKENLVSVSDSEFPPNKTTTINLQLSSQTNYLGIVANYREIDGKKWLQMVSVGSSDSKISIQAAKNGIEFTDRGWW